MEHLEHEGPDTTANAVMSRFVAGLDLGQSRDYSALIILEVQGAGQNAISLARHLQRWELGTSYPDIVGDVVTMMNRPELRAPVLCVDQTGVGAPVVDLFRNARRRFTMKPVHITGGEKENHEEGVWRVPKRSLVSLVQVALQSDRLKIAKSLPEARTLVSELQNFQVKITDSGNDTYGAWREGTHDDLVLALAMALWEAERKTEEWAGYLYTGQVSGWNSL